jgi:hypothetical protein
MNLRATNATTFAFVHIAYKTREIAEIPGSVPDLVSDDYPEPLVTRLVMCKNGHQLV